MSSESTAPTAVPAPGEATLQKVRSLGSGPLGEAFEVLRLRASEEDVERTDQRIQREHLVLKRIHGGRLKAPDRFPHRFEALTRLDHPHLAQYRECFVGEQALRILRDFVDGVPLTEYLTRRITSDEEEILRDTSTPVATTPWESSDQIPAFLDDVIPVDASPVRDLDAPRTEEIPEGPDDPDEEPPPPVQEDPDRPTTLEIPHTLLEDSEAADRALDLIILRLRTVLPPILSALEYLHRYRQIHGGLKPSNIVVDDQGQAILTDFGIYPELDLDTDTGLGFVSYAPPETADGDFGPATDLYSLGAILFEALADQPFGEGDGPPRYLSEILPHCPASWADLIHGLLAEDPSERPGLKEVEDLIAASEERSVTIRASVVEQTETLFGRRERFNEIAEIAKSASQNRVLTFTLVDGEAGVGKTALLDALSRWAAQLGWVTLRGRFLPDQPITYQGLAPVMNRLAELLQDLPEKAQRRISRERLRAGRLFPCLLDDDSAPPDIHRRAAVDGLRQVLECLSEQRPVFLALDDLHHADPDVVQLLEDLAEAPRGLRVMVAATRLPKSDSPTNLWTQPEALPADVHTVSLETFSATEAQEYLLAQGGHLTLPQKQEILEQSHHNPLLIEEMIHHARQQSLECEPAEPAEPAEFAEPSEAEDRSPEEPLGQLASFVEDRSADLSRAERLVLQLLAVARGPVPAPSLEHAMKRELGTQRSEESTGAEVARALVHRRLARQSPANGHQEPRFEIIHDHCRQVISQGLSRDHRARLFGLLADGLDRDDPRQRDQRFELFLRAGRDDEALRVATDIAHEAAQRFAFHRAARIFSWVAERSDLTDDDRLAWALATSAAGHHSEATELLRELRDTANGELRLRALIAEAAALMAAGERPAATSALEVALHDAHHLSLGAPSLGERLRTRRARLTAAIGRWSDVTEAVETDESPPPNGQAPTPEELLLLAIDRVPLLDSTSLPRLTDHFGASAHRSGAPWLLATDRLHMVGSPWLPFLTREGQQRQRWIDQAGQLLEHLSCRPVQARHLETSALWARHHGRFDDAREHIDAGLRALHRWGQEAELLRVRLSLVGAEIDLHRGRLEESTRALRRLRHRTRQNRCLRALVALFQADLFMVTGDLDGAHRELVLPEEILSEARDSWLHLWWMLRRTRLHIARGQPQVAVAEWDLHRDRFFSRALLSHPIARQVLHQALGQALCSELRQRRALDDPRHRESLRRLRRVVRRLGDVVPWMGLVDQAFFRRLQAHYELLRGRPQKALRIARQAQEPLDDHRHPFVAALNHDVVCQVLHHVEEADGRRHQQEARQRYETLGVDLPLVLEGWPVPPDRARLRHDDPAT